MFKKLMYLFGGMLIGSMFTYIVMKKMNTRSHTSDSHVIEYEMKKLNKMIVAEQSFSDVFSHKNSRFIPGLEKYLSFDKKVLYLVNAKVQATYDMSKLEVKMDESKKIIYINKIPDLEIKTYPDIKFYDMEQSSFNTFDKDELNEIKDNAIEKIEKRINKNLLEEEAHNQLIENLSDIYLLAKAYGWKVEDNTKYKSEVERFLH